MPVQHRKLVESFVRHLAYHGAVAPLVPVAALIILRGLDPRIILLFGLPPTFAALYTSVRFSQATRSIAWAFLGMIGLGSIVAHVPSLFPKLGGVARQLASWQDRTLTWYAGVYLVWFFGVLPLYLFGGSLRAHWEGRLAPFSRPTCYLGLAATALLWMGFPGVLGLLGFWPVF